MEDVERPGTLSFGGGGIGGRALLAQYCRLLNQNGYVHAVDVPEDFDYLSFLARFGAFYPGPTGQIVEDVRPEPGMEGLYSGGNKQGLLPHTEGYEYEGLPPRYLALWCVVPPAGPGGETTLLDARDALEDLNDEVTYLYEHDFAWNPSEGLRRKGLGTVTTHPMLDLVDGNEVLRFSCNNVTVPEQEAPAQQFLSRTMQRFESNHQTINYRQGDLLHWDNWRMLHSRNQFSDPKRHLKRVQIRYVGDGRLGTYVV